MHAYQLVSDVVCVCVDLMVSSVRAWKGARNRTVQIHRYSPLPLLQQTTNKQVLCEERNVENQTLAVGQFPADRATTLVLTAAAWPTERAVMPTKVVGCAQKRGLQVSSQYVSMCKSGI